MENHRQFRASREPVLDAFGNQSRLQFSSQGHTAPSSTGGSQFHNVTTVSSTSLRLNSLLLDDASSINSQRISAEMNTHSQNGSSKGVTEAEQIEHSVSSNCSTVADTYPRLRSRLREARDVMTRFWLWETAACVFSLMSLASVVGVLVYEDGKQLDQWAWSIPPTAVVAFITTLAKASLVLVLSQVLSQLKWLYFRETNSLQHLRTFDGGSRGPLGAVLVVWNSKKLLASIAASLMILTILVDPFIQLVFTFPTISVEDQSQQAIFQRLHDWRGDLTPLSGAPSPKLWASINQGFATSDTELSVACPSSGCVWPGPIKTLGICGSCTNETSNVQVNCSTEANVGDVQGLCTYTFSDGSMIPLFVSVFGTEQENYTLSTTVWDSLPFKSEEQEMLARNVRFLPNKTQIKLSGSYDSEDIELYRKLDESKTATFMFDGTMVNFNAIHLPFASFAQVEGLINNSMLPPAICWTCNIRWCEKSFSNVRTNGTLSPAYTVSEQPLSFIWSTDAANNTDIPWLGAYPSEIGLLNDSTAWNFRYRVTNDLSGTLLSLFFSYFYQNVQYNANGYVVSETVPAKRSVDAASRSESSPRPESTWPYSSLLQTNLLSNPAALVGLVLSDDLNATISRFADSLSENIRTGPNSTSAIGQVLVGKSFIHVRWKWLALPLTLMAVTFILLPIVAIKSRKEKVAVWKDDPLALLFHRVDTFGVLPGSDSKTGPADLNNLAEEMHVRLDRDTPFTFLRSVGDHEKERKKKGIWYRWQA